MIELLGKITFYIIALAFLTALRWIYISRKAKRNQKEAEA